MLVDDITGAIVMDDFYVLEIPGFRLRAIEGARRQIICNDIVVRVLLEHLDIVERSAAVAKILNEPGSGIGSIAKDLSFNQGCRPRTRLFEKRFSR